MKQKQIEGKPLQVSNSINTEYSKAIKTVLRAMHTETVKGVQSCFDQCQYTEDSWESNGGSISVQLRVLFNYLSKKYNPIFTALARRVVGRMTDRVLKNSSATLKMSLREMGDNLSIKTDFLNDRLKDITEASALESVNLIKVIPDNYLTGIQRAVIASVATGKGFADLKPTLTKHYKGNARKAELTAMDQTRKLYQSVNAERMKQLGVKKFKWLHSGGGREPRKLHVDLHGKVFSFDEPPFIGVMYGEDVYGLPGVLPNCGCSMSPVFEFEETEND
ncbi:phage head morphogenesis protein [Testudinibacter sp. P80/BLE/0925]